MPDMKGERRKPPVWGSRRNPDSGTVPHSRFARRRMTDNLASYLFNLVKNFSTGTDHRPGGTIYEQIDSFIADIREVTLNPGRQADPRPNTPSYSQGYAPPPYHWTDRGRVRRVGGNTTVPAGTFGPLLLVEEFSDTEPGAIQLKYYAQGVGLVRVGWAGDDPRREVLELVRVTELGPEAMAEVHAEAFAIEGRAYVYASTAPAQRRAA